MVINKPMQWMFAMAMVHASMAHAELFGGTMMGQDSCSTPALLSIKADANHAYVGISYRRDNNVLGALLKYRTQSGVIMSLDKPIYHNNTVNIHQDLWASGNDYTHFGTQARLNQYPFDQYLWLAANKHDQLPSKIFGRDFYRLSGYDNHELSNIAHILGVNMPYMPIGAVIYPPDINREFGSLVYGDTLGVIRMADISTGRQQMAYVPTRVLGSKLGIDAHWRLYQVRDGNHARWIAVGGFGQSAKGLLALDVSDVPKGLAPKIRYQIMPNHAFDGISHIHAPISLGYIKQEKGLRAVFVFGGGVDKCYENNHIACQKQLADGAVIYMIDALTGQKISQWQGVDFSESAMIHSFGGELSLIDRQRDGAFDHVYAADLGGQIFRFDITYRANTIKTRVGRIFYTGDERLPLFDKKRVHFYQKPMVSIYRRRDYPAYTAGTRFAVISIASNDQYLVPGKKNYVYGIYDQGLIDRKINTAITPAKMVLIDDKKASSAFWPKTSARSKGWYQVLNINGDRAVTLLGKGMITPTKKSLTRQGVRALYRLTVVKPSICPSAMSSQPQAFCLPFGVCHHQVGGLGSDDLHKEQGDLTTPILDGAWMDSLTNIKIDNALVWQALQPNLQSQNQSATDVDLSSNASSLGGIGVPLIRHFYPMRWYDVRGVSDDLP